jgi:Fe2+ transport system protein FeoA
MVKRLSELEIGSSAIVLDTIGNKDFIARLCALGLCAQDKLTIEAKSYKGKTIKVAVVSPISKTMIAIRDTEASLIMVQEDQ